MLLIVKAYFLFAYFSVSFPHENCCGTGPRGFRIHSDTVAMGKYLKGKSMLTADAIRPPMSTQELEWCCYRLCLHTLCFLPSHPLIHTHKHMLPCQIKRLALPDWGGESKGRVLFTKAFISRSFTTIFREHCKTEWKILLIHSKVHTEPSFWIHDLIVYACLIGYVPVSCHLTGNTGNRNQINSGHIL